MQMKWIYMRNVMILVAWMEVAFLQEAANL